jgi:signal transduction histidine kinase
MKADINMELLRFQRLASLGRDLEGFVHNAAGPLNIILGYVQILQGKYPEETGMDKIWAAGTELNEGLLELSGYLEEVQYEMIHDIDINEMIHHKLELLRSNSEYKHNIESVEELADDLPKVRGVYGDVVICLDVILTNAIEAVEEAAIKKIIIRSELESNESGEFVKITIRDTGDGIEEALRSKYFELGYCGWEAGGEERGVGLTLASYIMGRTGGKISLENSCGCGSEAIMYLPTGQSNAV